MKSSIIHEFGHLAGLEHEQLLKEAAQDPRCAYLSPELAAGRDYGLENLPNNLTAIGPYDPDSIMNYCLTASRLATGNSQTIQLSEGDRSALRNLYP